MRRLAVSILGTEIFAVELGEPAAEIGSDHDHLGAHLELAEPHLVGFQIQRNPSVED